MRKLIIVFFIIFSVVQFVGCKFQQKTHVHTISTLWSSDDLYHWKEASCGKIEHIEEKNLHTWDDGKIFKIPTQMDYGVTIFTCKVCKKNKEEQIAKLPYKITYHSNNGLDETYSQSVENGSTVLVNENSFEAAENWLVFSGWSISSDKDSSVKYISGASITPSGDIDLYAVWIDEELESLIKACSELPYSYKYVDIKRDTNGYLMFTHKETTTSGTSQFVFYQVPGALGSYKIHGYNVTIQEISYNSTTQWEISVSGVTNYYRISTNDFSGTKTDYPIVNKKGKSFFAVRNSGYYCDLINHIDF